MPMARAGPRLLSPLLLHNSHALESSSCAFMRCNYVVAPCFVSSESPHSSPLRSRDLSSLCMWILLPPISFGAPFRKHREGLCGELGDSWVRGLRFLRTMDASQMSRLATDVRAAAVTPEDVLNYWFKDLDVVNKKFPQEFWFMGGEDVDKEIKEKFGDYLELASSGRLDHWKATPRGRLALVIVLDQFSRNIFRGTAHAYAQDETALNITLDSIKQGLDKQLDPVERYFFYMPLMHSERQDIHEEAYRVIQSNAESQKDDPGFYEFLQAQLKFEMAHNNILAKYGRYPSRNAELGRKSTPEEEEYLASGNLWPMPK